MKEQTPRAAKARTPRTRPLPNDITRALGENLKRYRLASGLTQEDLAYSAELERSRVSKMEGGHINPSLLTLATLCHCLGITLPALFEGVSATMAPVAQGGIKRRANQATLEPPPARGRRKA